MNKELKQKWIAALRSGDYPQTQSELCNSGGYCCLGVLCDLVDNTKWSTSHDQVISYNFGYSRCNEFPTHTWLNSVVRLPRSQAETLSLFNDEEGYDFHEIAQWIQDKVEETA